MGSTQKFAEYVHGQLSGAGTVSFKKMFGEYAFYFDGKVVALVCDDRLFVRPTAAGRAWIGTVVEGAPYPGAKLHFLIEEQLDDRPWLAELIQVTASELPVPKAKAPKTPKAKGQRPSAPKAVKPRARKGPPPKKERP
ncbi:MAG: TfoX/Sxy family protein [Gemmatimonadales bacterium]